MICVATRQTNSGEATVAMFDVWHRPGNVHDSNGARSFILSCLSEMRQILRAVVLEVRMDCAFFSDEIVSALEALGIQCSISVPFERFVELKLRCEKRFIWRRCDRQTSFFACHWKPNCWEKQRRFIFIRTREPKQRKEPLQLGLFAPYEYGYQFKVILTNAKLCARKLLRLHNGRGAQEGILFVRLGTRRMRLIQRAGRLTSPQGRLTLPLSANPAVQTELLYYLAAGA